ncbi:hypothetical protein NAT51_12870 [Flavobacterium amniphilum]|uniref:hypothetical protein n=1 Tax=Flavobacterium amniphilum TaxID=1834035 RepID=UPI00202AB8E7|nr:hypothetical protein [Flavobacterium amniphilum]MCL9805835.1 hypothetical protein [Flavobacterium amniphilum]MCL9806422.1 hypothetical protein [Flavobacterium amniphilum]
MKNNVDAHPNSHYLSDFIIRPALNIQGSSKRDLGFYFGFDSDKPSSQFRYQRGFTKFEKVEEVLGRQSTEEEIVIMKQNIEFSSNDKFCIDCEPKFTKIENLFNKNILPKLRDSDLTGIKNLELSVEDSKALRLFVLLNFFRTSICDDEFQIQKELQNILRDKIFNYDFEGLENIHLSVSYLETLPNEGDIDNTYKTENIVGIVYGANPKTIFFNDFVITLIDGHDFEHVEYNIFEDINSLLNSLNIDMKNYKVKIFSNDERKFIINKIATKLGIKIYQEQILDFYKRYVIEFNKLPTDKIIGDFIESFLNNRKHATVEQNRNKLIF